MTHEQLKQAAADYLAKALGTGNTDVPPAHMVQAAVAIALSPSEQK